MKAKESRQKTDNELQMMLKESREKLRALYFDLPSKKLKNVRQVPTLKKQIAQILTILKERK